MDELRDEAEELHHCADSYVDRIYAGESYLYRVMTPERGTLEIDPRTGEIVQFLLAYNQEPQHTSCQAVKAWHQKAQGEGNR